MQWSGLLLSLGLTSTLVVWGGQTYWALIFSIVGVWLAIRQPHNIQGLLLQPYRSSTLWLLGGFVLYALLRMLSYLIHGNRFNVEPLIPFLLFPFLAITVTRYRISQRYFWLGIMAGALFAAGLAAYQHFFQGIGRAQGFANPIPFGDSCVVFALAAVVGASGEYARQQERPWFRYALLIAAVAAGYASLLSGSRGGWLSLLMVAVFGGYRIWKQLKRADKPKAAVAALLLAVSLIYVAPSHVVNRIQSGATAGAHWLQTGEVMDASVSYRFEMWAFGLTLFKENPMWGASRDEWLAKRQQYVDDGRFSPKLLEIHTTDSQFIGDLAEGGLAGISVTLLLLIAPLIAFKKLAAILRSKHMLDVMDLSTLGLWIPIVFAEFGLSVSLWGLSVFRQIYVSWLVLLLALIVVAIQDHDGQAQ